MSDKAQKSPGGSNQLERDVVHQSGFPFQIGVRHEIDLNAREAGWKVVSEEHYWRLPLQGRPVDANIASGYVDLVAERSPEIITLVIECKRVRGKGEGQHASWLFLTPKGSSEPVERISALVMRKGMTRTPNEASPPTDPYRCRWWDVLSFSPASPESSYCVFESQDEKSPTLERIADTLLPSVEATAIDWVKLRYTAGSETRVFVPMIVTTAKLFAYEFDGSNVSMEDGSVRGGIRREVPLIRFRKALGQNATNPGSSTDLTMVNDMQQRTILIANSAGLASTLKALKPSVSGQIYRASEALGDF